jgi:hypothetical protein
MRSIRQTSCVALVGLFLLHALCTSVVLAQQAVPLMTLANGTKVTITQAQFDALVAQPGITYVAPTTVPQLAATQMAIPVPSSIGGTLGGGFIVGEPAALAAGMNAVGITTAATGATLAGGTAATGTITAGAAAAGAAAAGGIGAGTIAVGAGILAAGAAAAAAGGGGGGGGGGSIPTTAHH